VQQDLQRLQACFKKKKFINGEYLLPVKTTTLQPAL
jgi:hypothetical protein